jgi:6-phosphogluconolactonase
MKDQCGKGIGEIPKIIVFEGKKRLVDFAVRLWSEVCIEASHRDGLVNTALSGGHTPIDFYRALAARKKAIEWEKVHIFLVDERFVLPAAADSNYHMIRETLLDNVPIPEGNVHPVRTVGVNPDEAAFRYEEELKRHFKLKEGQFPRFDLIVLGLGEDGHTASLFPGSPGLLEADRWAVAVKPDRAPHDRITLTLPVVNNGRCVAFLVTGSEKAEALKGAAEKKDPELPAAHVNPAEGSLFFLADRDAAGLLSKDIYVTSE